MKSNEIQEWTLDQILRHTRGDITVHDRALLEIAYQLAKMNERMDKEDEKFFESLPSRRDIRENRIP